MSDDPFATIAEQRGWWVAVVYTIMRWLVGWHVGKLDKIEKRLERIEMDVGILKGRQEERDNDPADR
jgi:hypothetical protein